MKRRGWRFVKWASLATAVGSVAVATLLMWAAGPKAPAPSSKPEEQTQTKVESPVIIERREGEVIWQLRAAEANQQLDGRMHLIRPQLLLFTAEKKEIPIEGEEAWFDPLQRNIHFQRHVTVRSGPWLLASEEMIYDNAKDEVHIPGAFELTGETVRARGKVLRLSRESEIVTVDKGVRIEDSHPRWQGVLP